MIFLFPRWRFDYYTKAEFYIANKHEKICETLFTFKLHNAEHLSFWRDFSLHNWKFEFYFWKKKLAKNWEKIVKKFVKLCLHSSYTMQNSFHFDEIFHKKIIMQKFSWKFVYVQATHYRTPFILTRFCTENTKFHLTPSSGNFRYYWN